MSTIDANKLLLDRLSDAQIKDILDNALAAGAAQAVRKPESAYHWFPCGFAWVNVRIRKNAKQAKLFLAAGFTWNDYDKAYQLWAGKLTHSQSMEYKYDIMVEVANVLRGNGISCSVGERAD